MTDTFTRAANGLQPTSWNATKRTMQAVVATETPYLRTDRMTGEPYYEVLEITPEAVDLSRFIGAPILDTHDGSNLSKILGVVLRAWIENRKLIAEFELTDRAEVSGIIGDIVAGRIRNVSVGYAVTAWDDEAQAGRA